MWKVHENNNADDENDNEQIGQKSSFEPSAQVS